jgi:dTDP-glucose pyrophosphorylase
MKGVILAAGKGTRMGELAADKPKPMVVTGRQTILDRALRAAGDSGVKEILVVTGYHENIIRESFGDGRDLGIALSYVTQPVLNGTATAVKCARAFTGNEPFFLGFGDIITAPVNYPGIIRFYEDRPCDCVIAMRKVDDPSRFAAITVDGDARILHLVEKPPPGTVKTNWVNAGLFIFTPLVYEYIERVKLSTRGEYELTEALEAMVVERRAVRGFGLDGYWGDMASPEAVAEMSEILRREGHD